MELSWTKRTHPSMPLISVAQLPNGGRHIFVTLLGPIGNPIFYNDVVRMLNVADEQDVVTIGIDTPGGELRTGNMLIAAIKRCKAHVHTHVLGWAYSCGAYMWSYGKTRTMGKYSDIMFHTSSHGDTAKTRDVKQNAEITEFAVVDLLKEVLASKAITQDDFNFCLEFKRDLFLKYPDFIARGGDPRTLQEIVKAIRAGNSTGNQDAGKKIEAMDEGEQQ